MRKTSIHCCRQLFQVMFLFLSATDGLGQVTLEGKIQLSKQWKPVLYVSSVSSLEGNPQLLDSVPIGMDGRFSFFLPAGKDQHWIYQLLIAPQGSGPNTNIEGVAENFYFLCMMPNTHTRIEAEADSFFYSSKIKQASPADEFSFFQQLKQPFKELHRELVTRISHSPDSVNQFKQLAATEWMRLIMDYCTTIRAAILNSETESFRLLGLYYYYLASFGIMDSAFFAQTIQRSKFPDQPLISHIKARLATATTSRIGRNMQDRLFQDQEGNRLTLTNKSRLLVLDFWASWCGPCRQAIKNSIPALAKKYPPETVVFIGVNVDSNPEEWLQALEQDKPLWPQLRDLANPVSNQDWLRIYGLPTYLILDASYKVIGETVSDITLSLLLEKFLGPQP